MKATFKSKEATITHSIENKNSVGNSKSVGKGSSYVHDQKNKDPKKKAAVQGKKITDSIANVNVNVNANGNRNRITSMKYVCKSAPVVQKNGETKYSSLSNENYQTQMLSEAKGQKGNACQMEYKKLPKNAKVNLWRKPLVIECPDKANTNCNHRNIPGKQGHNSPTSTHVLSTNFTDNNTKDKEINLFDYKNAIPAIQYDETPKNKHNSNANFKYCNAIVPSNRDDKNNAITSEILSSIQNIKGLIKPKDNDEIETTRLLKSEENRNMLKQLNMKLSMWEKLKQEQEQEQEQEQDWLEQSPWKEKYSKVNVINANMLDKSFSQQEKDFNLCSSSVKKIANGKLNEVQVSSDLRLKRYEILFEFLHTNLKEINQVMTNTFKGDADGNPNDEENVIKNEENTNTHRLSSLHSKINLTSKTNANGNVNANANDINNNENICDYEDSEMQEKSIAIIPVGNVHNTLIRMKSHHRREISPSLLISTISSDYYRLLLEESNVGVSNLSNEMGSIRTQSENLKILERMISIDNNNYTTTTNNNNNNPLCGKKYSAEDGFDDNEGEENVNESGIEKTQQNIPHQVQNFSTVTPMPKKEEKTRCITF